MPSTLSALCPIVLQTVRHEYQHITAKERMLSDGELSSSLRDADRRLSVDRTTLGVRLHVPNRRYILLRYAIAKSPNLHQGFSNACHFDVLDTAEAMCWQMLGKRTVLAYQAIWLSAH